MDASFGYCHGTMFLLLFNSIVTIGVVMLELNILHDNNANLWVSLLRRNSLFLIALKSSDLAPHVLNPFGGLSK